MILLPRNNVWDYYTFTSDQEVYLLKIFTAESWKVPFSSGIDSLMVKLESNVCRLVTCFILKYDGTANGKREFVPRDQVFDLLIVYCSLELHENR